MLEDFDFEIDRIRTVMAIMDELPTFRPDDLDVAGMTAIHDTALAVRNSEYIPAEQALNLGTAAGTAAVKAMHEANIAVYGSMKSRYRGTPQLDAIQGLPVDDRTDAETEKRARSMAALWGKLPLPPNAPVQPPPPPHFYIPYDGMTLAIYEAVLATMMTTLAAQTGLQTDWEVAEGNLHEQGRILRDTTVSAGAQGRAQFPDPLSMERELIDSIPTDAPVSAPGTCTITQASSDAPGEARLKASSARAVKFDWERETAPDEWTPVATDVPLSVVVLTGLEPGNEKFRAKGKNSKGESEWSEAAEVTVMG